MATNLGRKPSDIPIVSRRAAAQLVGGDSVVLAAQAKGVLVLHRTPTGRDLMTTRQFEALVKFSQSYLR